MRKCEPATTALATVLGVVIIGSVMTEGSSRLMKDTKASDEKSKTDRPTVPWQAGTCQSMRRPRGQLPSVQRSSHVAGGESM